MKLGYYDYFHPVLLSFELGCTKPDPKIFDILLQKLQVLPEECLLIDNKPENIEAAQKVGLDGICFTSAEHLVIELKKRDISLLKG